MLRNALKLHAKTFSRIKRQINWHKITFNGFYSPLYLYQTIILDEGSVWIEKTPQKKVMGGGDSLLKFGEWEEHILIILPLSWAAR